MNLVRSLLRSLQERATAALHRGADRRAQAICPVDSWAFTPLYTAGRCPLCGWTPEGYVYSPPPLTPYERYWGAMGGIVAISVLMAVVVGVALTR
jgi:hypothetical protein